MPTYNSFKSPWKCCVRLLLGAMAISTRTYSHQPTVAAKNVHLCTSPGEIMCDMSITELQHMCASIAAREILLTDLLSPFHPPFSRHTESMSWNKFWLQSNFVCSVLCCLKMLFLFLPLVSFPQILLLWISTSKTTALRFFLQLTMIFSLVCAICRDICILFSSVPKAQQHELTDAPYSLVILPWNFQISPDTLNEVSRWNAAICCCCFLFFWTRKPV